jgi:hypothetical protein
MSEPIKPTTTAADAIDEAIELSKAARLAAIQNGLGNVIGQVITAAGAIYAARLANEGNGRLVQALDEAIIQSRFTHGVDLASRGDASVECAHEVPTAMLVDLMRTVEKG